jgi:hypothetical protein
MGFNTNDTLIKLIKYFFIPFLLFMRGVGNSLDLILRVTSLGNNCIKLLFKPDIISIMS